MQEISTPPSPSLCLFVFDPPISFLTAATTTPRPPRPRPASPPKMRSGACALLGRLFSSKYADFGVEKAAIWSTFLGRFIDADSEVSGEGGGARGL